MRNAGKLVLKLLLIFSLMSSAYAWEIEDKKWTKAISENYVIYSRMSKGKTVDLLKHLETFRLVTGVESGSVSD